MQLCLLLAAFLAATACSPLTIQSQTSTQIPTTGFYCVPIPSRPASATILPRMQRPRPHEMSLSPPPLSDPSTSVTNLTKDTNPSSNPLHMLPPPPAWVLTLEDLISAIFRIVITILTLFNVNITWRIRGKFQRMCWTQMHLSLQLTCPKSKSRSSTSQIRACMGRRAIGACLSRYLCYTRGLHGLC